MTATEKTTITITATVNAPVEKVWEYWNDVKHITQWNTASEDWHSPRGENDVRPGGSFSIRMEAKDGSFGFDFGGVYDVVDTHKRLAYTMGDGRTVDVRFEAKGDTTEITEAFDAETENSVDMQRAGWQAILDNFKKYTESN